MCGKDNQPGTRFCVHCGAALAASRPAAAPGAGAGANIAATPPTSATQARPATPPPVAAAAATATATGSAAAAPVTAAPSGTAPAASAAAGTAPRDPALAGAPAYDAEPGAGGGKIILAIGVAALVIAAGFIGYQIFGGSADVKDSFARFDTPPVARETPAPVPPSPAPPAPESARAEETTRSAATETPKGDPPASPASPTSPASPASPADGEKPKAERPARGEARAPPKISPAAVPPGSLPAPANVAPPPARVPAEPPAAPAIPVAPVQDRWAQMAAEQQQCRKENLFNRVICDQKVRIRFCNGYWGTVPQCPGAVVNPDKGQ
ncbi:MAG: hypothetical protein ABIX11_12455 [Casimicrobiaceae bacterium]